MRNPKEILSEGIHVSQFASAGLHTSYKLFLEFFQAPLTEQRILQGAYMVYGWMPTMLRIKGPVENIYNLAFAGRSGVVTQELLEQCAKTLNNSLVGTTKLLHFLNPETYPIWDSRVYRTLFKKTPHPYRVESPSVYLKFLEWLVTMEKEDGFGSLKQRFENEAGYAVSNKRAAEALLYALGPKPKKASGIKEKN